MFPSTTIIICVNLPFLLFESHLHQRPEGDPIHHPSSQKKLLQGGGSRFW